MGYFTEMAFCVMDRTSAEMYRMEVKRETSEALHRADLAMRGELEEYDRRNTESARWQMAALMNSRPSLQNLRHASDAWSQQQAMQSANMRHAASFGPSGFSIIGGLI